MANLTFDRIQQRAGRWAIVDLVGKRNRVRTIPIAAWVKVAIDAWSKAAGVYDGRIFRGVFQYSNTIRADSEGITPQVVYNVVKEYADELGFDVGPHDLRRTFAKLAHKGKSDLGQIQLNLGQASLKTTEDYLSLELDFTDAPSDMLGLRLV